MDTFDRIERLVAENGITGAELSKEIGMSNAVYYQWKKRQQKPSNKAIKKIADYFGVSVDYLLGNDRPAPYTNEYGVTVIPADPAAVAQEEAERLRMRNENHENMRQALNEMAKEKSPQPKAEGEHSPIVMELLDLLFELDDEKLGKALSYIKYLEESE